jgi:hypothetical protein
MRRKSTLARRLLNSTTDLTATADLVLALLPRPQALHGHGVHANVVQIVGSRVSENAPRFIVPAELVARSRPAGHSVSIV